MCRWYYTTVSITTLNKREIFNLDDWDGVVFQDADDNPIQYFHFLLSNILGSSKDYSSLIFTGYVWSSRLKALTYVYVIFIRSCHHTMLVLLFGVLRRQLTSFMLLFKKLPNCACPFQISFCCFSRWFSCFRGFGIFFLRLNTAHIFALPHSILRV